MVASSDGLSVQEAAPFVDDGDTEDVTDATDSTDNCDGTTRPDETEGCDSTDGGDESDVTGGCDHDALGEGETCSNCGYVEPIPAVVPLGNVGDTWATTATHATDPGPDPDLDSGGGDDGAADGGRESSGAGFDGDVPDMPFRDYGASGSSASGAGPGDLALPAGVTEQEIRAVCQRESVQTLRGLCEALDLRVSDRDTLRTVTHQLGLYDTALSRPEGQPSTTNTEGDA